MDGEEAKISCSVDEVVWKENGSFTTLQLAFLGAQVECLAKHEVLSKQQHVATCVPSVGEAISRKDADRAVWMIKERLYWSQFRAAALLLIVFRELLPSKYWYTDDCSLLQQYGPFHIVLASTTTLNVQNARYTSELERHSGVKHLALKPPPQDDPDKGLEQMLSILTTMHSEFFRLRDAGETSEVAKVFDEIRPRFTDYPP